MGRIEQSIKKLGMRWFVKPEILQDVYYMMLNDPRFFSAKAPYGIKYLRMSLHLKVNYRIELSEAQLKYMVKVVKKAK